MPPIPGKPKPQSRQYRYGADAFVCKCGAVHWYDAKQCQGCKRSGPLSLIPRKELASMRGMSDRFVDDEDDEEDEEDDEDSE